MKELLEKLNTLNELTGKIHSVTLFADGSGRINRCSEVVQPCISIKNCLDELDRLIEATPHKFKFQLGHLELYYTYKDGKLFRGETLLRYDISYGEARYWIISDIEMQKVNYSIKNSLDQFSVP